MIDSTVLRPALAEPEAPRGRLRLYLGLFLVVCLIAVGLYLARSSEQAGVEELRRNVQAGRDGGSLTSVRDHSSVGVGDLVRTDTTGRAQVDYPDGSMTRLGPDTIFAIEELRSGTERVVTGRLDLGRSLHRVERLVGSEDRFEVATHNALATVHGTEFIVECSVSEIQRDPAAPSFPLAPSKCNEETLAVSEGEVEWYSGGLDIRLRASECRTRPGNRPGVFGPCKYTDEELAEMFAELGSSDAFPASSPEVDGDDSPNSGPRPLALGSEEPDKAPAGEPERGPATPERPGRTDGAPEDKKDEKDRDRDSVDAKPSTDEDPPAPPPAPPPPPPPAPPDDPGPPPVSNDPPGDGEDGGSGGSGGSEDKKCVDEGQNKCQGEQKGFDNPNNPHNPDNKGAPEDKGKNKKKDGEADGGAAEN